MKRYLIVLLVSILCIFPSSNTKACWVYLSTDQLVEMSDAIIIGSVIGSNKKIIKTEHLSYNTWNVEVDYYIKGEYQDKEIIISTPDENTSLHYTLEAKGNKVILFLKDEGDYFTTHSPQAVVGILFEGAKLDSLDTDISGEDLLKAISISDERMSSEEKQKLEDYLSNTELILSSKTVQEETQDTDEVLETQVLQITQTEPSNIKSSILATTTFSIISVGAIILYLVYKIKNK